MSPRRCRACCCGSGICGEAGIRARLSGARVDVPVGRLAEGALSGNLGAIDSPAFQLHRLVPRELWLWQGTVELCTLGGRDTLHVRLRQLDGQIAWTLPSASGTATER
jgi:hypothetical protein